MTESNPPKITTLFWSFSPKLMLTSTLFGVISGLLYAMIIPVALKGIENRSIDLILNFIPNASMQTPKLDAGTVFMAIVISIFFFKTASVIIANHLVISCVSDLKINICHKINNMRIVDLEQVGLAKIVNVVNSDVSVVASSAMSISNLIISLVTIIGVLCYLAFIDVVALVGVIVFIVLGLGIFFLSGLYVSRFYSKERAYMDGVQEGVRGLVMGAFELKLDNSKSAAYIDDQIVRPQKNALKWEKLGDAILHCSGNLSDLMVFIAVGSIVFIAPNYFEVIDSSDTYGVVMALLFLISPVGSLIGIVLEIQRANVALERIKQVYAFSDEKTDKNLVLHADNWKRITIENLSYTYRDEQNVDFRLGPISLTLERGKTNFIVGANGSGKSTLSKLLSFHYESDGGRMYIDDQEILSNSIQYMRSKVSVIYSNYYLFESLYSTENVDVSQINEYLYKLGLEDKVKYENGKFSTLKLSDGQRRRLALVVSLIEDREIFIFDEWAADQDPIFKEYFYTEILEDLRRRNKLIVIISHDDRYFHCADNIFYLEDGRLRNEELKSI